MARAVGRQIGRDESTPPQTILVVDDDSSVADAVAAVVRDAGFSATVATSWSEALRIFWSTPIDLVITDAVMPTVDGAKLATLMRGKASSYVPILMLTSLTDRNAREHAIAAGVDDVLAKPPNPFEIVLRVRALLRIRKLTTELERKTKELDELARRDPLTGLGNRRSMNERLAHEVARALRYGHPLTVAVFDLDHFKRINDTFGHGVGDDLLEFFGTVLRSQVRTVDFACRFGGEEFVLILPETKSDNAGVVVERIRREFATASKDATPAGAQTLSCGFSGTDLFEEPVVRPEDLLRTADIALYVAKRGGRNRCCRYSSAMSAPQEQDRVSSD